MNLERTIMNNCEFSYDPKCFTHDDKYTKYDEEKVEEIAEMFSFFNNNNIETELNEEEIQVLLSCVDMAERESYYALDYPTYNKNFLEFDERIKILQSALRKLGCSESFIKSKTDY
jgi:hypothetical protein